MELKKVKIRGFCKPKRGASGTDLCNGFRKIAIIFEQDLFDEIGRQAVANGNSFGAQVRIYVAQGMAPK